MLTGILISCTFFWLMGLVIVLLAELTNITSEDVWLFILAGPLTWFAWLIISGSRKLGHFIKKYRYRAIVYRNGQYYWCWSTDLDNFDNAGVPDEVRIQWYNMCKDDKYVKKCHTFAFNCTADALNCRYAPKKIWKQFKSAYGNIEPCQED